MRGSLVALVTLLLFAPVLAGCLGKDEVPAPPEQGLDPTAKDAVATAETGSVQGRVLTFELDEVAGASVALVAGADIAADTKTAKDGTYTFNEVPPGEYLVQVSAVCCNAAATRVTVSADAVTKADLQVERIVYQEPYLERDEWTGFIACGVGTPAISHATCTAAGDPNDDFSHEFNISAGIHTLMVGMDWDPSAGLAGERLMIVVERCNGEESCGQTSRYARVAGDPPMLLRFDDETIERPDMKFANLTEEWKIRLRVFTPFEVSVTYQQPFTVYMDEFYHEGPAEDFNPFPDR